MRLRYLADSARSVVSVSTFKNEDVVLYSIPAFDACGGPESRSGSEIESDKLAVRPGDVLISRLNPRKSRVVRVQSTDGLTLSSTEFVVLRPTRIDGRYLTYLLRAESTRQALAAEVRSVTRSQQRVEPHHVGDIAVPVRSPGQQHAIADLLDRECGRIAMLEDTAMALCTTSGDNDRAWRDQRLDQHAGEFGRLKLGWLADVLPGFAFASTGFKDAAPAGTVRLLRGVNVGVGRTRWDETVGWDERDTAGLDAWRLRVGDLVLGMDRPWIGEGLRLASLRADDLPAYLLQRVARIRPYDARIDVDYLRLWLERDVFRHDLSHSMTGVSVPHISGGQIERFRVAVPPRSEQLAFVEADQNRSRRTEGLVAVITRLTTRLAEYRDALIAEAVTGQLDIATASESQLDERLHAAAEGATA